MNAYELANELQELDYKLHLINLFKSATMLRQQADRISKLEDKLSFYELKDLDTHPVKQLSDEEISDATKQYFNIHPEALLSEQFKIKLYELEDFARAIIKEITE